MTPMLAAHAPACAFTRAPPSSASDASGFTVAGERRTADHYICALPFEKLPAVGLPAPDLQHSPITGVHLWFDREVTTLPHATLLDRTMQWMFNKDGGRYLQLVVSASRDLTGVRENEIVDIAIGDLRLFFPRVHDANLVKAHVVKEQRATFSAAPETESLRPTAPSPTCIWPATGPAPAGRRPWKAPCAAVTWRPKPSPKRRVNRQFTSSVNPSNRYGQ